MTRAATSTTSAARSVTVANANAHQTVVALGFDDGDADQYDACARSSRATTCTGRSTSTAAGSGTAGYMTAAQLQTLAADGNEIAGHTVSHADLPTLDQAEQARQVCNDRVALLNLGFSVRSFAYPYGDVSPATETIVQNCGYNNARIIGGLVTPTSCSGCAYSEPNPPADVYAMRTNDSIKSNTTLAQMQGYVTQAEQHGGGLVPIVMHHVSTSCAANDYCVSPTVLDQFLTWLQPRSTTGTVVTRIGDFIGGAVQPGVSGPAPPAVGVGANLLQNPSLETDTSPADGFPDCWQLGGFGTNTPTLTRTSDAHSGSFGEQISVSSVHRWRREAADRRSRTGPARPAHARPHLHRERLVQDDGNARIVVYTRNAAGGWAFFAQQAAALPAASAWTQTTYTTPPAAGRDDGAQRRHLRCARPARCRWTILSWATPTRRLRPSR